MVDEKDRIILEELQKDGRKTFVEIAKKVGLTSMGAKKRVESLIDKGIIKIKALLNVDKLDVKLALIAMEIESGKALRELLKRFENCPRVIKFFVTTGSFNLFALVWAEDYHTLESISLESCSLRAQRGVRRFEFYPIMEIYYDGFLDVKVIADKRLSKAPCGVKCDICERFKNEKCLGCPATKHYKGKL